MPKIATNLKQVREITAKLATERPEYVYEPPAHQRNAMGSCYYVHTNTDVAGTPKEAGCIVGNVLHELGVPLEAMQAFEGSSAFILVDYFLSAGTGAELDDISSYLASAQIKQDSRKPWGDALVSAESTLRTPALV